MSALSTDISVSHPLVVVLVCGPGVDPVLAAGLMRTCLAGCGEVTISGQGEGRTASPEQAEGYRHRLIIYRTPQVRLAELLQCNVGQGAAVRALDTWRTETRSLLLSARQNRSCASLVDLDAALAGPDNLVAALWGALGLPGTVPELGGHISRLAGPQGAEVFTALAGLLLADSEQSLCEELAASGLIAVLPKVENANQMLAALHEVVGQGAFYRSQSDALTEDLATSRSGLKAMLDLVQSENVQLHARLAQTNTAMAAQQPVPSARHGLEMDALVRTISNLRQRIGELDQALALSRKQCGALREAKDAALYENGTLVRSQKALQHEHALLEAQLHAATTQKPVIDTVDKLRNERDALQLKLARREQNFTNRLHEFAQRREIEHRRWDAKSRAQAELDSRLQSHLKKLQADLEAALACVESQQHTNTQMQARITELEVEVESLNKMYVETMLSTSWRITAPLRRTKLLTTRIFD